MLLKKIISFKERDTKRFTFTEKMYEEYSGKVFLEKRKVDHYKQPFEKGYKKISRVEMTQMESGEWVKA